MDDYKIFNDYLLQDFDSVSALLAEGDEDVKIELCLYYAVLRLKCFFR